MRPPLLAFALCAVHFRRALLCWTSAGVRWYHCHAGGLLGHCGSSQHGGAHHLQRRRRAVRVLLGVQLRSGIVRILRPPVVHNAVLLRRFGGDD